jgi:hypothetical protein
MTATPERIGISNRLKGRCLEYARRMSPVSVDQGFSQPTPLRCDRD